MPRYFSSPLLSLSGPPLGGLAFLSNSSTAQKNISHAWILITLKIDSRSKIPYSRFFYCHLSCMSTNICAPRKNIRSSLTPPTINHASEIQIITYLEPIYTCLHLLQTRQTELALRSFTRE